MAAHPLRAALRGSSLGQILHLTPVRPQDATGQVAQVYRAMEREFGVVAPPVALHSPVAPLMAASWLVLREALLIPGTAGRTVKETVATAVSRTNTCPYCVTVHGAMLRALQAAPAATGALEAWADWTRSAQDVAAEGGLDGQDGAGWPVPAGQAGELIAVVVLFHYLNRVVNVFLGEAPMPPGAPSGALAVVGPVLARIIRSGARRTGGPGEYLELLPAAELPGDLAWADTPALAGAFARAAAAMEEAGMRWVPDRVRALVTRRLAAWDGSGPGLSRSWVAEATAGLPEEERAAGRLALLTALASYQVDATTLADVRADHPGDEAVLGVASWAAMAAARRVGRAMADREATRTPPVG